MPPSYQPSGPSAPSTIIQPLDFLPGVQRDGTMLDSQRAVDSLWTRWRLGRARKMKGYQQIAGTLGGLPRNIHAYYNGLYIYIHVGTTESLQQYVVDLNGTLISSADRTPLAASFYGIFSDWTFDSIFDTVSGTVRLVAHINSSAKTIASTDTSTPFLGPILSSSPLVAFSDPGAGAYSGGTWTVPSYAGGIVCIQPYVFGFDVLGRIAWSGPNQPLTLGITGGTSGAGQVYASSSKIVAGLPVRGGGTQQPAALFLSLNEAIYVSFVGSNAGYFGFNTISSSSSILSQKSFLEYDGIYYWAGRDRFLMYNGTVLELPNTQNQDWFFDNLTPGYESKTYAFKVPKYGEIWFCAALFGATEPSHAVIFNVRESCFYDTVLPNGGRSAGKNSPGFKYTIMGGTAQSASGYPLWLHEIGTDEVNGSNINPVRSYFETPWFGSQRSNPPLDKGMTVQRLEPDILQSGDLSVTVLGSANAKAPLDTGPTETIKAIPSVPQEQLTSFKQSHRLSRLHIESNTIGGNFVTGKNLLHVLPSDARVTSG